MIWFDKVYGSVNRVTCSKVQNTAIVALTLIGVLNSGTVY